MPKRASRISLLILMSSPFSCADASQDATAEDLADLDLVEVFRIGSVEDPDIGFSRIGPVAVAPNNDIYVAESEALHVRVYSETGALLRVIGRSGEGPGEFASVLGGMGFIADTLWVSDSRNRRISLFTGDGALAASIPAPYVSVPADPAPRSINVFPARPMGDGMWESSARYGVSVTERTVFSYPNLIFDRTGAVVDTQGLNTVDSPPAAVGAGEIYFNAEVALASWPLMDEDGDQRTSVVRELARSGDPPTFEVVRATRGGDTLFVTRVRYAPIEVDGAYVDRVLALASAAALEAHGVAAVEATLRSLLPRYHPPVSALIIGEDGSTWLRREDDGGDLRRWLLLAPSGDPLGHVSLARDARIAWARADALITVEPDAFTVPWLVRYRISG